MKKITLAIALCATTFVVKAQITIDPEIGLNFNKIKTEVGDNSSESDDSKTGFRIGAGVNIPLSQGFYVKPGLFYSNKGSKTTTSIGDFKTSLDYLEVPVNLGYQYKIEGGKSGGIFAEVGPYIGFGVSGKYKGENIPVIGSQETDINFGSGSDETKGFDWGFNFGAGYETPWGIYLKGQYGLGLGNLSNIDNVTSYNRGWNLSLGYQISL